MNNITLAQTLNMPLISLMRVLANMPEDAPINIEQDAGSGAVDLKKFNWRKASRLCPQSDLSRIAGKAELPTMDAIFSSPAYLSLFRSHAAREIYVGACSGLARNSAILELPEYKISTVAPGRLPERIGELKADVYGGKYISDGAFVDDADGFDDWFASHIYTQRPTAPNSPVEIHPRALTVHLPVTMSPAAFDAAFDHEIRKAAVDLFVQTPEGAAHCEALRVDPAIAQRYTAYPLGSAVRHSACQEIVIFRIREDSDRLVAIAEMIVLRHLGLIA